MFAGSTNGARTAEPGEHGNTHTLSSINKYRHSYCATMCDVMTCVMSYPAGCGAGGLLSGGEPSL